MYAFELVSSFYHLSSDYLLGMFSLSRCALRVFVVLIALQFSQPFVYTARSKCACTVSISPPQSTEDYRLAVRIRRPKSSDVALQSRTDERLVLLSTLLSGECQKRNRQQCWQTNGDSPSPCYFFRFWHAGYSLSRTKIAIEIILIMTYITTKLSCFTI